MTKLLRFPRLATTNFVSSRASYSSVATEQLSQRELREKAIADALAKEEEQIAKAKAVRELKQKTLESIESLNKIPSTLINERLRKLQADLGKIPEEKVKQLDQELEEFMMGHMQIPTFEIMNKPWTGALKTAENHNEVSKIGSTTSTNEFPNLKPTPDFKPYSEQELYIRQLAHSRQSGNLGSKLTNIYKPRNDVVRPKALQDTTIATLLAANCHLGHSKAMWRPSTQPFIYGEYDGIHIIDLNETITALKKACSVVKGVSRKGGIILYVGTGSKNFQNHRALEEAATRSKGYYVSKKWIPGTITNFTEVTKQIKGESIVEIDMQNVPTGRKLGRVTSLIKPDLVVLLNPVGNRNCITECSSARVPTIGLCDTDMEPSLLSYPIPCNDDSTRAQSLILGVLSKAAEEGLNERLEAVKTNKASSGTSNKGSEPVKYNRGSERK